MGAFALGNAGPNLQHMSTARGAASYIWDLVDRVSLYQTVDNFFVGQLCKIKSMYRGYDLAMLI